MALTAVPIDKRSPFLGEACALCKQPFGPGDEVVICPDDATRHHLHCWRANDDSCTAYGCQGKGRVDAAAVEVDGAFGTNITRTSDSKVQTLPTRGFHCAQSCLLLTIALAIILFAIGCFGLWAIADYLMIEVLEWQYRAPISSHLPNLGIEISRAINGVLLLSKMA